MKSLLKKLSKYIPIPSMIIFALAIITAVINIAYCMNTAFADYINENVSSVIRIVTAYLTAWIPFSVAEYIVFSFPVLVALAAGTAIVYSNRKKGNTVRAITALLSVAALIYIGFALNLEVGYHTTTLDKKMELTDHEVSADDLYDTLCIVIDELNGLEDDIELKEKSCSRMPYTHAELVDKCCDSYDILSEKYGFITSFRAPVKRIILSPYMTYTHISGIYTFFTGEANLNTNYPDFVNVFTTAHEMAHQRGIIRENEANFIAYLVCISSDDDYMRFSGYLNMYEYLSNALYEASPQLYSKAAVRLNSGARHELKCYSDFFEKYSDNIAADVSEELNNSYLTSQGTEGTKSYGMVVDLAVAYYKTSDK